MKQIIVYTKYVYGLGLIGEETSGNFKTYHFDYRGSTVAITDSNCNITDTFTYDTYGKLKSRTGTTKTPFLYNGRDGVMYEDDTGLIYMRARYYSPTLRRFVNADKLHGDISNSLSLNRYAFVNGNPAVNVDPEGLNAERVGVGTAWGGIGAMEQCMFQAYENNKKKNFTYWLGYLKELSKLALIERLDIDAPELVLYSSGFGFVDKVLDIFKIVHYSRNYFNAEFPESSKDLKGLWNSRIAADCHQFSVPADKRKDPKSRNKKYVSFDGHYEAIYGSGGEGQIVTDPRDVGTYNFISPAENKVGHGIVDVAPWVIWGNSYNDSTTISERIIFSIF